MITPERGLFDMPVVTVEQVGRFREAAQRRIVDLEQRLAEAENYISRLPADWDKNSSLETWFPFTAEKMKRDEEAIAQLRARCEDLGNIAYKANAANEHWNEFGHEHGFDECMNRLNSALTEIQPKPAQEQKG